MAWAGAGVVGVEVGVELEGACLVGMSSSFTKCAPHLNLKPCLSQATRSKPLLIVQSKEKQRPKLV